MTKAVFLSQDDLECLQAGRSLKLAGLKLAANILHAQMELVEKQIHAGNSESGEVNGTSQVKPSMLRTLAAAGITPLGLPAPESPKKRGRPKKSQGMKGYWANMTPKERRIEMRRRADVRKGLAKPKAAKAVAKEVKQPNHPRNAGHPKHKQWLAKTRRATRKYWDDLTPTVRDQHIQAALAGRRKKIPTVKVAS